MMWFGPWRRSRTAPKLEQLWDALHVLALLSSACVVGLGCKALGRWLEAVGPCMWLLREALLLLYLWCLPYQPLLQGPLLLQCGVRCWWKALHTGARRSWILCCQPGSLSPGLRPPVASCPSPQTAQRER